MLNTDIFEIAEKISKRLGLVTLKVKIAKYRIKKAESYFDRHTKIMNHTLFPDCKADCRTLLNLEQGWPVCDYCKKTYGVILHDTLNEFKKSL